MRTGDGTVWIGQVRVDGAVKLPAAVALAPPRRTSRRHCCRSAAIGGRRRAPRDQLPPARRRRRASLRLLQRGDVDRPVPPFGAPSATPRSSRPECSSSRGGDVFSNGIHLNVIHAAPSPALEAWRNINAIDDVCREIITCTSQLVVASLGGNAGAGGVMLALGADRVLAARRRRAQPALPDDGPVRLGVLDLRAAPAGRRRRGRGLTAALPADRRAEAARIGLVDEVLPGPRPTSRPPCSTTPRGSPAATTTRDCSSASASRADADERHKPLEAYRIEELAEMSRDLFDDRNGFAAAREAFVTKQKPTATPPRLAAHRTPEVADRPPEYAVQRAKLSRPDFASRSRSEHPFGGGSDPQMVRAVSCRHRHPASCSGRS